MMTAPKFKIEFIGHTLVHDISTLVKKFNVRAASIDS